MTYDRMDGPIHKQAKGIDRKWSKNMWKKTQHPQVLRSSHPGPPEVRAALTLLSGGKDPGSTAQGNQVQARVLFLFSFSRNCPSLGQWWIPPCGPTVLLEATFPPVLYNLRSNSSTPAPSCGWSVPIQAKPSHLPQEQGKKKSHSPESRPCTLQGQEPWPLPPQLPA